MTRFNWLVVLGLFSLLLAGCNLTNPMTRIQSYKLDIPQGNYVTQEMMDKLKPGMTRSQVRFVLGTPLLVDPFRENRWDYVYTLKKNDVVVERRRVTVVFDGEVLKGVDVAPQQVEAKP
jgi:outer membrane protein assembly factor BamE